MTKRIGIVQQKGGVAKTTDTINIAGALADRGVDVPAVDMDPQGYLPHRLGFKDELTFKSEVKEGSTDNVDVGTDTKS